MKKPTDESLFLSEKRSAIEIWKRQKKNKIKRNTTVSNIFFYSKLIDHWVSKSALKFKSKKNELIIKIPKNFSIIENPEDSLTKISQIAAAARQPQHKKVHFIKCDHSNMEDHDLAAESLLGLILKEFEKEYQSKKRKLKISGLFPSDAYLTKYIKAIGVIKDLDVTQELLSEEQKSKLNLFNKRSVGNLQKITSGSSAPSESAAKKFVDYINACLARINKGLTMDAIDLLSEYAGEVLANAEEHGGLGDWTIRGYYDPLHDEHNCEIAIFNFGKTIAETFIELPKDSYAFQVVQPYIELHNKNGLFSDKWTKETLLTLVALQGDISSKNVSITSDRGQGTVEMIQFFQKIHTECCESGYVKSKMAVLSGSTHILFDGSYQMLEDSYGRKIIAFNKENSLALPPDNNCVKGFNSILFPGTIISMKFILEETSLKAVSVNHE